MKLQDKQAFVDHWKAIFDEASVVVMADYSGLKANEINALRRSCHDKGVEFHVVKNTLAKLAIKDSQSALLADHFKGPVGVATGIEDQVAPAKVLVEATKEYKTFELIAGALDGQALDVAGIEQLAKMPGRDELRAQFLALLSAVPGGFVRLLNAVPGGMVNVLDARKRELEENAA